MRTLWPKQDEGCTYRFAFETSPNGKNGEVSNPPLPTKKPQSRWLSRTGTAYAVNYNNIGVAAHSSCHTKTDQRPCKRSPCVAQRGTAAGGESTTDPTASGRGGARNRADRESHSLSAEQVANLVAATSYANAIGLPFTRMITIHWEAAGLPLSRMAKATGRFLDLMTKMLARHGTRTAWLWVHEGGHYKGGHCHLLVHVPADRVKRLNASQKAWLRGITGNPYRKRVISSRPIGGRLGIEHGNPAVHEVNLNAALGYVLKGASAAAAVRFQSESLQAGGRVIGKRCGTSQNIGASARNRKGG